MRCFTVGCKIGIIAYKKTARQSRLFTIVSQIIGRKYYRNQHNRISPALLPLHHSPKLLRIRKACHFHRRRNHFRPMLFPLPSLPMLRKNFQTPPQPTLLLRFSSFSRSHKPKLRQQLSKSPHRIPPGEALFSRQSRQKSTTEPFPCEYGNCLSGKRI